MKIMILGAAGFLGGHLTQELIRQGHEILGMDDLSIHEGVEPKWIKLTKKNGAKWVLGEHGDCTDYDTINDHVNMYNPDIIYNLAVKSLPHSLLHPCNNVKTNVGITLNILEYLRHMPEWMKKPKLIHFSSCYDEKTRAYIVGKGYRYWNDIKIGDKVLSINTITGEIEEKPIVNVIKNDFDGDMIHFKTKSVDLLVTPNHRMVIRTLSREKIHIMEASKLEEIYTGFRLVNGKWNGTKQDNMDIDGNITKTDDVFYITGIYIGDGSSITKYKQDTKTGMKRSQWLEDARNLDGTFKKLEHTNEKKEYECPRAFLYIPKKDKCRIKVEDALNRMKIKWTTHQNGDTIYFSSKTLNRIFDECGHKAKEKKIPEWMLKYDISYLNDLLDGILDSDGNGKNVITTISEELVSNIAELTTKMGWKTSTSISKRRTSQIKGRDIICERAYYISINKTKSTTIQKIRPNGYPSNISHENYNGIVWCVSVEDNKNLLVERNGKIAFCGNSEVYGTAQDDIMTEEHVLRPTTPYAAAKNACDALVISYVKTYGIDATIVRPFNCVGPRQNDKSYAAIIPLTVKRIKEGIPPIIYGDGSKTRDFTAVEDIVRGAVAAMEHGRVGEVYNLCSSVETSVLQLMDMISEELDYQGGYQFSDERSGDVTRHLGDNNKAKRELGWTPKTSIRTAVHNAIHGGT